MSRAPKDRFPTAGDLAEAAASALDSSGTKAAGVTAAAVAAAALAGPATVLDLPVGQETVIDRAVVAPAAGEPGATIIASGDTLLSNDPVTPVGAGGTPTMIVGAGTAAAAGAAASTAGEGTVLGETAFDVIAPRPGPDATASFADQGGYEQAGTTNTVVDDRLSNTKGRRRRAPVFAAAGVAALLVAGTVAAGALLNPRGLIAPSPSDQGVARGNVSPMVMTTATPSSSDDSLESSPSVAPPTPTANATAKPPTPTAKPAVDPPAKVPTGPKDTAPPTKTSVAISSGAKIVTTLSVNVSMKATGATWMRLGNYGAGTCGWKPWVQYATTYPGKWALGSGSGGTRTVCAQYKSREDPALHDRRPGRDAVDGQRHDPEREPKRLHGAGHDRLLLRPGDRRPDRGIGQLHLSGQGRAEVLLAANPAVANNPLIFPPADILAKLHIFNGLDEATEKYFNDQFGTVSQA